jgi:hypothetical protein
MDRIGPAAGFDAAMYAVAGTFGAKFLVAVLGTGKYPGVLTADRFSAQRPNLSYSY